MCKRASAAVTVVLPCPEAGAAISKAGQRAAGLSWHSRAGGHWQTLQAHKQRAAGRGIGAGQLVVLVGQIVHAGQQGVVAGHAGAWHTG